MILSKLEVINGSNIEISSENENDEIFLFDEIEIAYCNQEKKLVLYEDFLCEGIRSLQKISQKALTGELEIDEKYFSKGMGYEWNIISNRIANDEWGTIDITSPYALWSTSNKYATATWIYSFKGEIYFEVSPQYKWNYSEPEEDENFIPFEEFVQNYQFYIKIKIDKENLISWNEKRANQILKKMKG